MNYYYMHKNNFYISSPYLTSNESNLLDTNTKKPLYFVGFVLSDFERTVTPRVKNCGKSRVTNGERLLCVHTRYDRRLGNGTTYYKHNTYIHKKIPFVVNKCKLLNKSLEFIEFNVFLFHVRLFICVLLCVDHLLHKLMMMTARTPNKHIMTMHWSEENQQFSCYFLCSSSPSRPFGKK